MSRFDRQRFSLLEWVEQKVVETHSDVLDVESWAFHNGVSALQLRSIIGSLFDSGLLSDPGIDQGRSVALAPAGVSELQAIREKRANRRERAAFVRNEILRWLYDHEEENVRSLAEMIQDPDVHFYGDPLTTEEVGKAFRYLSEQHMVKGRSAWGGDVLVPTLLARGIECVESGRTVSDFIKPQANVGNVYNTYLPNAQGVIIGEQENVTQNNSAGIDPTAFVQLAGYVGQVSSTLNLAEPQRVELERVAQELHGEATSGAPDQGRLRALTDRILEGLSGAAGTIAGQIAIQMGQGALNSLG